MIDSGEGPEPGEDKDDDALEVLGDFVDDEYGYEWQRKGSIETRCFAIVTANVAALTVATTMADRLGLLSQLDESRVREWGVAGLVFATASIIAAVVGALPYRYSALPAQRFNELLTAINVEPEADEDFTWSMASDVRFVLVEAKIEQLRVAKQSNAIKAVATFVGFVALVAALGCLAYAFGYAVHISPGPS